MHKSLQIAAISLFFILSLFSFAYSQQEEQLTITTYYPAPSGSYHEMRVDQMSVGSGYRNQSIPANSLIVEGNVGIGTANPQAKLDVNGNVVLGGQYNEVIVKDANLIVEGPIQVDGEASIHDTLFVTNTNGVLVGGDLSVNKNLLIGYDATILGALKVDAKDATGGLGLAYDPVYRSTQASNIPYSCNADHRGEIRVIYDPGSQKRDALCWCGWRNRNNDEYGWSCILTN